MMSKVSITDYRGEVGRGKFCCSSINAGVCEHNSCMHILVDAAIMVVFESVSLSVAILPSIKGIGLYFPSDQ